MLMLSKITAKKSSSPYNDIMSKEKINLNKPEEKIEQEDQYSSENQNTETITVGKLLRQEREKKGLSIPDILAETNISSSNLISIEHENYNDLPADTFIRGQLVIYAKFLGLDGAETARAFFAHRDLHSTGRKKSRFDQHNNRLSAKRLAEPAHISSATWASGLLLLIITCISLFCWYTNWNPFAFIFNKDQQSYSLINSEAVPNPESSSKINDTGSGTVSISTTSPTTRENDAVETDRNTTTN